VAYTRYSIYAVARKNSDDDDDADYNQLLYNCWLLRMPYVGLHSTIKPSDNNCPRLRLGQLSTLGLDRGADIKQPCDNLQITPRLYNGRAFSRQQTLNTQAYLITYYTVII